MRRVDHQLQRRIDDCSGRFGVEVLHQLHRTLDVREQRRHRLALAVDCFGRRAIGGDYDLRFRRRNGRGSGGFCGANCGPAFPAKSRPRTHRCFARWANQLQLRSAFLAERGVAGVVVVAGRTAHRVSCRPGYYHTLRGRRKQHGALGAGRGVVAQRCSVAPPSHFVPAGQPDPGGVCHPVTASITPNLTRTGSLAAPSKENVRSLRSIESSASNGHSFD